MAGASEETESPFNAKDIQCFFSNDEWKELSPYDKINLFNKKRNYERMLAAGLTPKKPDFMVSKEERAAIELKRQLQSQADRLKKLAQKRDAVSRGPSRRSVRCNAGELREIMMKVDGDGSNTLFCDECEKTWIGECIEHGKLRLYPSSVDREKPDPALHHLPRKLEWVDPCNMVAGVRAGVAIPRRWLLGPYQGDVDVQSPATWMAFVRPSDRASANLRPLFYQGGLYFRVVATIRVGHELLLGPAADVEAPCGPCETCGRSFAADPFLQQHWVAAPVCAAAFEQRRRAAGVAAEEQHRAALAAALQREEEKRQRHFEFLRQERQRRRDELEEEREPVRQSRSAAARLAELRRQQEELCRTEVEIKGASVASGDGGDGDAYRCAACSMSFRRASLLRAHLKKVHELGVSAASTCVTCGAKFPTGDQLRNHILQTHFALKHFKCRKCDKVFSGMAELEVHTKLSSCVSAPEQEADLAADDVPAKRGQCRPKKVRFQLP